MAVTVLLIFVGHHRTYISCTQHMTRWKLFPMESLILLVTYLSMHLTQYLLFSNFYFCLFTVGPQNCVSYVLFVSAEVQ